MLPLYTPNPIHLVASNARIFCGASLCMLRQLSKFELLPMLLLAVVLAGYRIPGPLMVIVHLGQLIGCVTVHVMKLN